MMRASASGATVVDDRWMLVASDDQDIAELMQCFPQARSVNIWGGPNFRFPFTPESFRADCRLNAMSSYCLRDPDGGMVAFGQIYDRQGRGHLARLIVHPDYRLQGVGRRLVAMLVVAAERQFDCGECSLFVYRDNAPAYRCYLAMGITVQEYPVDAALRESCHFLTRASALPDRATTSAADAQHKGRKK